MLSYSVHQYKPCLVVDVQTMTLHYGTGHRVRSGRVSNYVIIYVFRVIKWINFKFQILKSLIIDL